MQPFLGEIRAVAFTFAPSGWIVCDGRQIAIQQNTALFSIIGTYYGGNGTTTFALPNLQGTALVGTGQGNGLSPYVIGEVVGEPTVTLVTAEMPTHSHQPDAKTTADVTLMHNIVQAGDQLSRFAPAGGGIGAAFNKPPFDNPVAMDPQMIQPAGGNQAHENRQPYLSLLYCIAVQGVFPSRN